jgi:hypothetical protein
VVERARYRQSDAGPRSQRASGYFVVSAGGPQSYLLSCPLNTIRARPVAREALEALVQHASEAPSPLIAPNRDEMDIRQCLRRDDEPEQVRRHSAVLVPDHEGTVAELVDEHRMVHRGQVTLAQKAARRSTISSKSAFVTDSGSTCPCSHDRSRSDQPLRRVSRRRDRPYDVNRVSQMRPPPPTDTSVSAANSNSPILATTSVTQSLRIM